MTRTSNIMDTIYRRRNAEQRDNILRELLTTEREYCRDLKLLFQVNPVVQVLKEFLFSIYRHSIWTVRNN